MSKAYYYFKQTLFYLLLIAYILLLAKILLFKDVPLFELFNADRAISRTLNLLPFSTISEYFSGERFNIWFTLMNVAGNIVLFIPAGAYLQIFKIDKRILPSVALVCAISLCVEITQYALGIGRADIDDIILNTLGGLLGVFIYRGIYLWLKDKNKAQTAITYLFCLAAACFGAYMFFIVHVLGYMVKIF